MGVTLGLGERVVVSAYTDLVNEVQFILKISPNGLIKKSCKYTTTLKSSVMNTPRFTYIHHLDSTVVNML